MVKDTRGTVAAMLSSAPALTPVPDSPRSVPRQPVVDRPADNLDDSDLEAFELEADAPLVRPRRRKNVEYQTVRINKPTARILRAQWLRARQVDPLLSYTEFSTIIVQTGLTALRDRMQDDA